MIFNNEERPGLSNEPSIQNQIQVVNAPVASVNFQINPHLKKVMLSKDQIKLHNPNKENTLGRINMQRVDLQKQNIQQARQSSLENSQAHILDSEAVPSATQGAKPMKIKMGQIMFTQSFLEQN